MKQIFRLPILMAALFLIVPFVRAQKPSALSIDSLLSTLTTREKVRLVVGRGYGPLLSGFDIPFCHGTVPGAAGETATLKKHDIRPIVMSDGPAGLRLKDNSQLTINNSPSAFPIGSLLACSWDTALVARVGSAMGREARSHDVDIILAPGMNLMRNPLCGRNFEYYSEDPLLTGWIASAMVRGIQSQGVGACAKHFTANNQETNRKHSDSKVPLQPLRELYLKPFEIVVRESDPWTVMSSYNLLNGELTQQSHSLLTEVLREEWGYQGVVMTDWTGKRKSVLQIQAGNDLLMPGLGRQRREIRRAIRRGKLCECEVDAAAGRVLELLEKCEQGQLAGNADLQKPAGTPESPGTTSDAHTLSLREMAAAGMVLLENRDQTLPLSLSCQRIALFGASSYEMIVGGTGSGHVIPSHVTDLPQALQAEGATLHPDLADHYRSYIRRKHGNRYPSTFYLNRFLGRGGLKEPSLPRNIIEEVEGQSDVAFITLGRQAGEGRDRRLKDDFLLTEAERQLLQDVTEIFHGKGKRVVVILNVGGVIETASWKHLPDAILLAWSPGQEGGAAMADILSGRINPSGCLSMTWPVHYEDHPSAANFPLHKDDRKLLDLQRAAHHVPVRSDAKHVTHYEEGMDVGYRYFLDHDVPVSYPFGYGLSYTTFTKSAPLVHYDEEGNLLADVEVTNAGGRAGRTVVQLYGRREGLPTELLTFTKTAIITPGETRRLTLRLPAWLVPEGLISSEFFFQP